MQAQHEALSIRSGCRTLAASRSGYYEWRSRPPRAPAAVGQPVAAQVQHSCAQGRGPCGTRRLKHRWAQAGLQGSQRRIGRSRAQAGWRGKTRRKRTAPRSAEQAQTIAPNQRHRACPGHRPAMRSVGAITALPTGAGWRERAVVLELCARAVVGWSMANPRRAALVPQALAMALSQRRPAAGLLRQTDRSRQSGADCDRQLLTPQGLQPRRSRQGTCGAHAVAESVFHTGKTALISREDFATHEQAHTGVLEYIEGFYNRQRCHAANGSLAPLVYAQALPTSAIVCSEKC
jgi:transposase InsO family protein